MRSLWWVRIQHDCILIKRGGLETHTQGERGVRVTVAISQPREQRALRHLHLGPPAPGTGDGTRLLPRRCPASPRFPQQALRARLLAARDSVGRSPPRLWCFVTGTQPVDAAPEAVRTRGDYEQLCQMDKFFKRNNETSRSVPTKATEMPAAAEANPSEEATGRRNVPKSRKRGVRSSHLMWLSRLSQQAPHKCY